MRESMGDVDRQVTFPGCSLLLHKSHLASYTDEQIYPGWLDYCKRKTSRKSWDWFVGDLLVDAGFPIICPKESYCDHYPGGGLHGIASDIGDNVTEFLKRERSL